MPLGRRGRTFCPLAPARPPRARLCVTLVSKTLSWVLVNARSLVSLHSGPARTGVEASLRGRGVSGRPPPPDRLSRNGKSREESRG